MGGGKKWRNTVHVGQPLGLGGGKGFENTELVLSSFRGMCVVHTCSYIHMENTHLYMSMEVRGGDRVFSLMVSTSSVKAGISSLSLKLTESLGWQASDPGIYLCLTLCVELTDPLSHTQLS